MEGGGLLEGLDPLPFDFRRPPPGKGAAQQAHCSVICATHGRA